MTYKTPGIGGWQLGKALRDTLPVLTGYAVLGMGFGILMNKSGFSFPYAVAMSLLVYAGSMQYAAVGLLTGGASLVTVALTTLAVNARHLFYGISMVDRYKNIGRAKPYLIFGLTDETYSLVCAADTGEDYPSYCFLVTLLDHIYWVGGTAVGALLGEVLTFNTAGIDFALTALFLTIFTDQWLNNKRHFPALTGVMMTIMARAMFGADAFLIPAMIGIAAVLIACMGKDKGGDKA